MKINLTPQRSFISIIFLAIFSMSGYFSLSFVDGIFHQEPPDRFPAYQQTHVNGTPSDDGLRDIIPVIRAYPNPFYADHYFIEILADNPRFENHVYRAVMYDILGKQVGGTVLRVGRTTIPAGNLTPGTYLVNVFEGERLLTTLKVIKQ